MRGAEILAAVPVEYDWPSVQAALRVLGLPEALEGAVLRVEITPGRIEVEVIETADDRTRRVLTIEGSVRR